jgi:hypothetical protein
MNVVDPQAVQLIGLPSTSLQAGYGFSLTDAASFEHALATHQTTLAPKPLEADTELSVFVKPLSALDQAHVDMKQTLQNMEGREMTSKDLLITMAKVGTHSVSVTFMTSITNKALEGVQQLFRQQS